MLRAYHLPQSQESPTSKLTDSVETEAAALHHQPIASRSSSLHSSRQRPVEALDCLRSGRLPSFASSRSLQSFLQETFEPRGVKFVGDVSKLLRKRLQLLGLRRRCPLVAVLTVH